VFVVAFLLMMALQQFIVRVVPASTQSLPRAAARQAS